MASNRMITFSLIVNRLTSLFNLQEWLNLLLLFIFSMIISVTVVANDLNESTLLSSTNKPLIRRSKNSELLSYKMYADDDKMPIFERSPNSDYLVLSRMQRQANRRRRQRNGTEELSTRNDDQLETLTPEMIKRIRRQQRRKKSSRRRQAIIPANVSRQAFDFLRSSVVIPSLGTALPSMMAKNSGFCKTIPFDQKISHTGCKSRIITNHYCYGTCNSFYIPSVSNGTLPFTSCSYCQPRHYRWTSIRLKCPYYFGSEHHLRTLSLNRNDDYGDNIEDNNVNDQQASIPNNYGLLQRYRYKKVQIVTKCRCQT